MGMHVVRSEFNKCFPQAAEQREGGNNICGSDGIGSLFDSNPAPSSNSVGEIIDEIFLSLPLECTLADRALLERLSRANSKEDLFRLLIEEAQISSDAQFVQHIRQCLLSGSVREPFRIFVKSQISHLDYGVPDNVAFVCGLPSESTEKERVKTVIALGLVDAVIPTDHPLKFGTKLDSRGILHGGRYSYYFDSELVGSETAKANIQKYVDDLYKQNLDNLRPDYGLGTLLNVPKKGKSLSVISLARTLVEQGFMYPQLPDGHGISVAGRASFYVNENVVTRDHMIENLRRYVVTTYESIHSIRKGTRERTKTLCRLLGVAARRITSLRDKLEELGWLQDDFRCGYKQVIRPPDSLPIAFRKNAPKPHISQPHGKDSPIQQVEKSPIGVQASAKHVHHVHLAKGEVFEQILGLALADLYADEFVLPQFCLLVDPSSGDLGTRVDFRVGARLIEAKWGEDLDSIESTLRKHLPLVQGTGYTYQVVTLVRNLQISTLSTTFGDLISGLPTEDSYGKFCNQIVEAFQDRDIATLYLLRDFAYTAIGQSALYKGGARKEYISSLLKQFDETLPEDRRTFLLKHSWRCYIPGEAHFEYDGVIYRTMLTPAQLQRDHQDRYDVIYIFDDLRFPKKLDRDVAVMLELAPEVYTAKKRAGDLIACSSGLLSHPVFCLPSGKSISTGGNVESAVSVNSLDDLREHLQIDDLLFEWGKEYLDTFGQQC